MSHTCGKPNRGATGANGNLHRTSTPPPIVYQYDVPSYDSNLWQAHYLEFVTCNMRWAYGNRLSYVPIKYRILEVCLVEVRRDGMSLRFVPKALRRQHPEMCLIAINQNGLAIQFVPKPTRTEEMFFAAIRQNIRAFPHVPKLFRTYPMCIEAMQIDPHSIEHVPEMYRTHKLLRLIYQRNDVDKHPFPPLKFVPEKYLTYATCMRLVQTYDHAFIAIPKKWRDVAMCLAGVTNNPMLLVPEGVHIPHEVYDTHRDELYIAAIASNKKSGLYWIPEQYRTRELCLLAMTKCSPNQYYHVPESLKSDRELILIALHHEEFMIKWVPKPLRAQYWKEIGHICDCYKNC